MTPKDKLGREIKVGDYIVYAQRNGSALWLDVGKVLDCGLKKDLTPFVKVIGCRDWANKAELKIRSGEITAFNRVVIVPKEDLPEKYLELLKDLT